MNTPHNNGAKPKQDAVANILSNSPPQLLSPRDLQARKLGQPYGLRPEMARTIAYLAFNPGARS